MRFGICASTIDVPPSVNAWNALRSIGVTDVRLTADLTRLFPNEGQVNWSNVDNYVNPIREAGLHIYMNPGGCPRWASEGFPAYEGLIVGNPDGTLGGTCFWNDPQHPDPNQIHFFDPNPATNRQFAAIDAAQPPRPYLIDPPKMSAEFMHDAGFAIADRYKGIAAAFAIGNEYGGTVFYPPMRLDRIANDGNGTLDDVVRDRVFPEMVNPFTDGVREAYPWAVMVGCEADSDIILERCCALDAAKRVYDVLSFHPYGDLNNLGYATMEAFMDVVRRRGNGRKAQIGEIGGDHAKLLPWARKTIEKYGSEIDGIYFGEASTFFNAWPSTPTVSTLGEGFRNLFAQVNARRRAVRPLADAA
jgi:hypothetical protein